MIILFYVWQSSLTGSALVTKTGISYDNQTGTGMTKTDMWRSAVQRSKQELQRYGYVEMMMLICTSLV